MSSKDIIRVYVDGSIRANGKNNAFGGVGIYGTYKGKPILKFSRVVNSKTNNESEYLAVIYALQLFKEFNKHQFIIYSDSQLVVNQINGIWRVEKQELQLLYNRAIFSINVLYNFAGIKWIPREKNKEADKLAKSIKEGIL